MPQTAPSRLDLKIPPPLVGALAAAAMYALAAWMPLTPLPLSFGLTLPLPPAVRTAAAWALAAVGLGFDGAAIAAFLRAKTTISPLSPHNTRSVVTSGVYRLTRNPMYLGMVLLLLGWAVYLGSGWALLGPVGFVGYINRFQIKPEERALAAHFGSSYAAYRRSVRRWL